MAATGHGAPPADLLLAWQCERWNTLPEAGGYMDQDYRTVYRMTALANMHRAVVRIKSLSGKDIHKLTDGERRILRALMDNGILFH